jgi:hypothetical protein
LDFQQTASNFEALHPHVEVIMKFISFVLIASLLVSLGCYNNQTIVKEDLDRATVEKLQAAVEERDIWLFTRDSLEYQFSKANYRIKGDTLTGFGFQTIAGQKSRFQGSIPFAEITSLKTSEFSLATTLFAIGLPLLAAGGFLLAFAIGMSGR